MLVTLLGGLGATVLLFVFIAFVLAVVGLVVFTVFKKTKEQGVVYKDGITKEEAATILRVVNESISAEKTAEFVGHVHDILGKVVKAGVTPPKL
jgi:uncharacterized membrane protein YraQ (UPF0718 family)